MPPLVLRSAQVADIDALDELETHVFAFDRISRRSFRRFIQGDTDELVVIDGDEGRIAGYALVLLRKRTALARLYSIAVSPDHAGKGYGRKLLAEAERRAEERDAIVLRLEVRADNAAAIRLYETSGYRRFGRYDGYYEDGMDALRFEKLLGVDRPARPAAPPYFEQTLDFTCGPSCMMMALAWADPSTAPDRSLELRLWREATTIFMTSGLGGCEPYGMAVALAKRGLRVELRLSREGPFFLDGVRSDEKRTVMRLTQEEFRKEASELGVPVRIEPISDRGLTEAFDDGAIAIVLVSGYRMFAKKAPHWLLAHGHDDGHVFVHDPWVEETLFETQAAAANLPIPIAEFQRMARYGRDGLRAAILIRKGSKPMASPQ